LVSNVSACATPDNNIITNSLYAEEFKTLTLALSQNGRGNKKNLYYSPSLHLGEGVGG